MQAVGKDIALRGWRQGSVLRGDELSSVRQTVEALIDLIRSAGIDVRGNVKLEDEVSYAFVRSFRRFPLDHLSLRGDPPDPMPLELPAGQRRGTN